MGFTEQTSPEGSVIENLTYLAKKVLEPIRGRFGAFSVSSGYRCLRLNRNLGSKDTSFHVGGYASDIDRGTRQKNKELFEFIRDNLQFTELINEYDFDWVHVAIVKGRENEKKVKVIV